MESYLLKHKEELDILGYTVIENVLSKEELETIKKKVFEVYDLQRKETEPFFNLDDTEERNIARVPFIYDDYFYNFIDHPKVMPLIREMLGNYYVLFGQNAVIVEPEVTHSMSRWHRDLSHMNFVADPPIAINVFFAITDFNEKTGGTKLVPHSHRIPYQPSVEFLEDHGVSVVAPAGSIFFFNTMMYHRTGSNNSDGVRIGLSHMYTKYFVKQQMDIPALLNHKAPEDPYMQMLLGFDSWVPTNVLEYRKVRNKSVERRKAAAAAAAAAKGK